MSGVNQAMFFSGGATADPDVASFYTTGAQTWTVPTGVTSINILGIAGGGGGTRRSGSAPRGGGGGGGSLITVNNVSVTPGDTIWMSVGTGGAGGNGVNGTAGGNTEVRRSSSVGTLIFTAGGGAGATFNSTSAAAGGTRTNGSEGTYSGGNGGAGGSGNNGTSGGGGAGGYTGAGGAGGSGTTTQTAGSTGSGGAGGGAGAAGNTNNYQAAGGGGTGPYGTDNNGTGGALISSGLNSWGGNGSNGSGGYATGTGTGGYWGGGGGGSSLGSGAAASGRQGCVVITWGNNMTWPSPIFKAKITEQDTEDFGIFGAAANYRLNSNGNAEKTVGGSYSTISGEWLVSGVNSDFESRATLIEGTTPSGTLNTWQVLSTSRTWGLSVSSSGNPVGASCRLFIEIRYAAAPNYIVSCAEIRILVQADGTV